MHEEKLKSIELCPRGWISGWVHQCLPDLASTIYTWSQHIYGTPILATIYRILVCYTPRVLKKCKEN